MVGLNWVFQDFIWLFRIIRYNLISKIKYENISIILENKMIIWEWFDPTNVEHLKAFKQVSDSGFWPKDFIPENIQFPAGWEYFISSKLADLYMEEKLQLL